MGEGAWVRGVGLLALSMLVAGCASVGNGDGPTDRVLGWSSPLGKGTVSTYAAIARDGEPLAIGIVFSASALDGLPASGSDRHHCFDRNGDGALDPETECLPAYEYVVPLPDLVARRSDIPFKWTLLTWNPRGHIPPGVYDVAHFDIHFFIAPIADVFAIEAGPCGPEAVRCDQFGEARKPLPPNYMHPDFKDVEAVVPAMGNHLIDLTSPEFKGQGFTRTWIFGVYGSKVTFYEEMVALAFLRSRPSACYPIKSPPAVGLSGFYPTESCIRYRAESGELTVSMEKFRYREASPPAAIRTSSASR